ncbi:MAG TPA: hypothetical protein P5149_02285 [Candidatus Competibacteraceae bacterium]|nr:hypothetical protein [Gammaproteobacteria bacterium]HRY17208.1 hypothetical protein [Candidatus Competibacteraceae bacterium]
MKIYPVITSLLSIVLLVPALSDAARPQVRTHGVYSDFNTESSIASRSVVASCESNEAATGGGCNCFGLNTNFDNTNIGYQISCAPTGDGKSFIGFCAAVPGSYDAKLKGPGLTVYVHCLVRGTAVKSVTDLTETADLVETPADQVNESDLSLKALQMKRVLERQAQMLSEKMMQQNNGKMPQ